MDKQEHCRIIGEKYIDDNKDFIEFLDEVGLSPSNWELENYHVVVGFTIHKIRQEIINQLQAIQRDKHHKEQAQISIAQTDWMLSASPEEFAEAVSRIDWTNQASFDSWINEERIRHETE